MLPSPILFDYGNTVLPPLYNVLFSLHDFHTSADIVDKSGNNIPVTNGGSVTVASNTHGTYLNFNGSSSAYLNFKNNILAIGTNMEIYFKISGLVFRGGQYLQTLMDTRPIGTNGNYLITGYTSNASAPFKMYLNSNNQGDYYSTLTLPSDTTIPLEIRMRILSAGCEIYVNDVLYVSNTNVITMNNLQNYTIGKNAFSSTANTPFLNAQLYSFEVRQLL